MIEALKDDKVINALGGRFQFTSLVQHRIRELMEGARPLVERAGRTDFEVAVQEVVEGKIAIGKPAEHGDMDAFDVTAAPATDTDTPAAGSGPLE